MKQLTQVCCLILLLSSCRKDKSIEYTSDVPRDFFTLVNISYYESSNKTTVNIGFGFSAKKYDYMRALKLPSGSDFKVNGQELTYNIPHYYQEFEGKPDINIEFTNYDGTLYKNTIVPPDTAYFIDFPDTVALGEDFHVRLNPPLLDSNESSEVYIGSHGDDYGCGYIGEDSITTNLNYCLNNESNQTLFFYRTKRIQNPNLPNSHLPGNGGSIKYNYVLERTFFSN